MVPTRLEHVDRAAAGIDSLGKRTGEGLRGHRHDCVGPEIAAAEGGVGRGHPWGYDADHRQQGNTQYANLGREHSATPFSIHATTGRRGDPPKWGHSIPSRFCGGVRPPARHRGDRRATGALATAVPPTAVAVYLPQSGTGYPRMGVRVALPFDRGPPWRPCGPPQPQMKRGCHVPLS